MSLFDALGLIFLGTITLVMLFILAMMLGAVAEWLVMKVRGHAAHR